MPKSFDSRAVLATGLCLAALAAALHGAPILTSPRGKTSWIRIDEPPYLQEKTGDSLVIFAKRFALESVPDSAPLEVRTTGRAELSLDGAAFTPGDFRSRLTPGERELRVVVRGEKGPALAFVACEPLGLRTGADWLASRDGRSWTPAIPAELDWEVPLSQEFPRSDRALISVAPLLLPVFLLVFWKFRPVRAETVRWVLLAAWGVLALNNIRRIPMWVGFDVWAHMRYFQSLATHRRLPATDESWQTFQAPLYYLLSAPFWAACSRLFGFRAARYLMRLIPLACGMAQVELSWRAAKRVFPARADLQAIATTVGGLLPMNLYMSQAPGNEPLAAFFSSLVVVLALHAKENESRRKFLLIGVFLGLALLTKVSAFLLVAPVFLFLARRKNLFNLATAAAAAAAICGWYYAGNFAHEGKFFFLNNTAWWQDPGYRTWRQLYSFGGAFFYPVYSGFNGFWDSLYSTMWLDGFLSGTARFDYRPPWNFTFMLSSAWLSVLPTAGIVGGALSALAKPSDSSRRGLFFAAGCVLVFTSAIFWRYATLPIYTTAKASYMLGLTPCFGLLAAHGLDRWARSPNARALAAGGLVCWALCAYLAYFVLGPIIPLGD